MDDDESESESEYQTWLRSVGIDGLSDCDKWNLDL